MSNDQSKSKCEHSFCNIICFVLTFIVKLWTRNCANVLAAVIMITGIWLNTLMLALTNERLPIQVKVHPDLLFDILPYSYEALTFTEVYILIQNICFILLLIFHQEREIILRRFMFIIGIIFLTRAITFTSTSISCPFKVGACIPKLGNMSTNLFVSQIFQRSLQHCLSVFSFSSQSKKTLCGDYIFSKQTVTIIIGELYHYYIFIHSICLMFKFDFFTI